MINGMFKFAVMLVHNEEQPHSALVALSNRLAYGAQNFAHVSNLDANECLRTIQRAKSALCKSSKCAITKAMPWLPIVSDKGDTLNTKVVLNEETWKVLEFFMRIGFM